MAGALGDQDVGDFAVLLDDTRRQLSPSAGIAWARPTGDWIDNDGNRHDAARQSGLEKGVRRVGPTDLSI